MDLLLLNNMSILHSEVISEKLHLETIMNNIFVAEFEALCEL